MNKSLSSSQENPADLQQVVAGESPQLGPMTVREAEAGDVAAAEVAAHQAEDTAEGVAEDMEEAAAKVVRRWRTA